MSTLKATNLQHASATSPNITLGSDGSVAVGGGNISPSIGMRNRIINGAMMIDQRNAGASVSNNTTGTQYTLDRWLAYGSQASKFTVQQNAGSVTPPVGFSNYAGITSSSAHSIGASEEFSFTTKIEGFNVADLAWGTANAQSVTLSFWVRSSLTGTFAGSLYNISTNRFYVFSYSIPSANTWTPISVTIAGDTTGTWNTTNGIGIAIRFSLGAGSTASGTAGSWEAANYVTTPGAVNLVATNGATWYITGVQLEKGSVATPFEFRSIGQELALCQRYGRPWGPTLFGRTFSATTLEATVPFNVPMRASPTMTFGGVPNSTTTVVQIGVSSQTVSAIAFQSTNPESAYIQLTTTGATAGSVLSPASGTSVYLGFASAEL